MKIHKAIYLIIGLLSLASGILGAFLPILPTTPFILLSVWCFSRSSTRLEKFVRNNRIFGKYIDNYYKGEGMSSISKKISVLFLWFGIMYSNLVLLENHFLQAMLTYIAIFVTVHILGNPTKEKAENESSYSKSQASLSNNR